MDSGSSRHLFCSVGGSPGAVLGQGLLAGRIRASQWRPALDLLEHEALEVFLIGRGLSDLGGDVPRHDDDALFIADDEVAREDWHTGTGNWHVDVTA